MKRKQILITLLGIILLAILSINNKSYAVLQSNGGTVATKDVGSWMSQIRNMEANGGSLGLKETINGNLTPSSGSNNLDCHMEKNTEYGAMAILSASSYGNPEKIENGGTTTGNASGVKINLNKEWVAAGVMRYNSAYANASARYKNTYAYTQSDWHTVTYAHKAGDAINETSGWHGSGASTWLSSSHPNYLGGAKAFYQYTASGGAGLLRAYSGSLFSYYGYCESSYTDTNWNENVLKSGIKDAHYTKQWASRAVIVVGEGF